MRVYNTPMSVNVDAYQASHFRLVPPGMRDFQCSQGVFRKPLHYGGDERADQRVIALGLRPYIDNNLLEPYALLGVDQSDRFFSTYHASASPPYHKPYPWPKEMFARLAKEYKGIPPIVVMGMREGQAHYVGEPHVQVFSDEPGMGELAGWIESDLLPYNWTSSIVATRGRIRLDRWIEELAKVYTKKTRAELRQMVMYKFVDFGRRGGASTQITGLAHFVNWLASDTCDAAYVAQMHYNDGEPFGASSIVAAAHRTVTPWPTEDESIRNAIEQFGDGFLAFVADSYNYRKGMKKLAGYAKIVKVKGGFLIGRPDSGDVVETVLDGMRIFEGNGEYGFGIDEEATAEANGLKVLKVCGVLQGDGVSDTVLFHKLFPAVKSAGFCPINLSVGMGEYNHRAVRSDTEDGYKTCLVGTGDLEYPDWRIYEPGYASVMKGSENRWKRSYPCPVGLNLSSPGAKRVYPLTVDQLKRGDAGDMVVLFDGRPGVKNRTPNFERWTETRQRAWESWEALLPVPATDTIHPDIRFMQERYMREVGASLALD